MRGFSLKVGQKIKVGLFFLPKHPAFPHTTLPATPFFAGAGSVMMKLHFELVFPFPPLGPHQNAEPKPSGPLTYAWLADSALSFVVYNPNTVAPLFAPPLNKLAGYRSK